MQSSNVPLDELSGELDQLFSIHELDQDPFSRFVPQVYQKIGFDYTDIFQPDFCERFNGLMLRSGDIIKEVYCAAFPTPEIVEQVMMTAKEGSLLFLHHPIDMEVSGVGFLPIHPNNLEWLRTQGISVYACHAPMDCHDEIGTAASIVKAFEIEVEGSFAQYCNGYAGRIGTIAPLHLKELIKEGQKIFGVNRVEIGGDCPTIVTKIAVVPGGGDDTEFFEEAEQRGADVYITGEWYTRTMPPDEKGADWAKANRTACETYAEKSKMAFLGFSHAATEFLVMKTQMRDYFRRKGLKIICLEQTDWWR
ncbi:MAG: Nif3-like dinuclear metal center hexameric protein [Candidatus Hodarchaeota archaeon]